MAMGYLQKQAYLELKSGYYVRAYFRDLRGKALEYKGSYVRSWFNLVKRLEHEGYIIGEIEERFIDPCSNSKALINYANYCRRF